MIELTTQVIGVTIESSFVQVRPFSKESLDQFSLKALDAFKGNGLKPEHIGLRTVDVLFGYELNFGLFGGGATVRVTNSQVILNFQNVQNKSALQIVAETAIKAHSLFQENEFSEHAFGVVAHMSFRDEQQREKSSSALEDAERQIEFLGRLAHVRTAEWPEPIRLQVDRSIFFPPGLFMSWNSSWRGSVDPKTLMNAINALAASANRLDFISLYHEHRSLQTAR